MWMIREGVRLLVQTAPKTTRWEIAKFIARSAVRPRLHAQWIRYLTADRHRHDWVRANPSLLWKLQRPYAMASLPPQEKLNRLRHHYEWLATAWPPGALRPLQEGRPLMLAELTGSSGQQYRFTLQFDERFAKEGELCLSMGDQGGCLATLAFSVSWTREQQWAAHVGCIQGPGPGSHGLERVRMATKDLHGWRPKQAVVQALYELVHLLGVCQITCVSNAGHVYQQSRRLAERVCADYDAFWSELGAEQAGAFYVMPARLAQKSLEEAPSRKRAQYRRRHELEVSLAAQVDAALLGAAARYAA